MARSYAQLLVAIWGDDDYRSLTVGAQWAYQMLISQRDLNYCGVVPYRLRRWSKFTASLTADDVEDAIKELAHAGYVVVDENTEELWVRSFMKHNKVLEQTQLRGAARAAFEAIESDTIRVLVYHSTPEDLRGHLTDKRPGPKPGRQGGEQGTGQPLGTGTGTSDLEPEPEPSSSSSNPAEPVRSSNGTKPAMPEPEEEDFASIEAARRLRRHLITTKIPWPEKWKTATAANLRIDHGALAEQMRRAGNTETEIADEIYRRSSGGLSIVREPCGACTGGLVFVGDNSEPCPVCTPNRRAS